MAYFSFQYKYALFHKQDRNTGMMAILYVMIENTLLCAHKIIPPFLVPNNV
jgi:hypothetical protein